MENNITYQEYWAEIKDLAKTVREEYDDVSDGAFETIDSHQWVIYNAYHFDVLKHCANTNAYFDVFGEAPSGADAHEILAKLASAAMLEDLQNELAELDSSEVEA